MTGRLSDRDERNREKEFYKYYEPIRALQQVKSVNLFDAEETARHVPISSPDTALTAFCQLGALRCQTRRCLLFFFDHRYAYILAEATQTLSLIDDNIYEKDDALWLGNAVIPRGLSVCEHTVNIPEENFGSNKDDPNASAIHIINDLQDDTRFCDRPFVTDGPKARFYAGVPITTPSGIRIGAYCVLDDKPRDSFESKHVEFLLQMSSTVMNHLENIRLRSEYAKGANMLTSMGAFLNAVPTKQASSRGRVSRSASPASTAIVSAPLSPTHESRDYFARPIAAENGMNNEPSITSFQTLATPVPAATTGIQDHAYGNAPAPFPEQKAQEKVHEPVPRSNASTPNAPLTRRNVQLEDDMDETLESSIKHTFQLAAEMIRKAADVSGMQFIDVSRSSNRDHTVRRKSRPARKSRTDSESMESVTDTTGTDATDATYNTDVEESESGAVKSSASAILGRAEEKPASMLQAPVSRVPNSLLRRILRRAPFGRVFNYSAEGEASATESVTEQDDQESLEHDKSLPSHKVKRQSDSEELLHYFPGARAIFVLGLWDAPRSRLYAAAVMWTCSNLRIFSNAGDLNYLRAFCDVIMANVSRIEARFDLQSKSQFISSISHELRSPLHGILGSIDLLHDQDQIDWSIIAQIERSSITLMDIIEHLLVFAKVNSSGHGNRRLTNRRSLRRKTSNGEVSSNDPVHDKTQPLVKLTEDVVDAIYHSHCCVCDEAQLSKVGFIFDANMDERYTCSVPVGAWKRICMNVTNNALKYTKEGHVMISLRAITRARKGPAAVFSVTDTGCGMSKHFLQNQLFRAFSQENSLSTGTGLGMSLVAKLVKSVAGQIDVTSIKNVGTTVEITIPLEKQDLPESDRLLPSDGLRLSLLDFSSSNASTKSTAYKLRYTALEHACAQIGASLVVEDSAIDLIFEADLLRLLSEDKEGLVRKKKPSIILCNTLTSASTFRQSILAESLGRRLAFIAQPFGPDRLAQALKDCSVDDVTTTSVHSVAGAPSQADIYSARKMFRAQRRESAWMKTLSLEQDRNAVSKADQNAELLKILNRQQLLTGNATIEPEPGLKSTDTADFDHNNKLLSRLQLADENAQPTASISTSKNEEPPKLCLLLVDDNHVNLRILTAYASRNGYSHQTATNGEEAVEVYRKSIKKTDTSVQTIDVIFMDINMPVMDGFEATKAIRALEKGHDCRPATVIALTGLGSAEAQQTARACGVDVFLTKPVRPRSLDPILRSVGESRSRDEDHIPVRSGAGKTDPSVELTLEKSSSH